MYPLKFTPIFKDKLWGGQKIKTVLGMDFGALPNCGEVWVISGYRDNVSVVENGFLEGNDLNDLISVYMGDLVGDSVYEAFGDEFPLLIKFIDAKDWLSIQVHPDDALAAERNTGRGKTEMWYILQADDDAQLISGFKKEITPETYQHLLEEKKLPEVLNYEKVEAGDVFFMPAGRIHATGPGVLLAEIQQSSDTTYRIYDWDRIDAAGMTRKLHIEEAMDAINFEVAPHYKTRYSARKNRTATLVQCPQFTTNLLEFDEQIMKDFEELDSFVIYMGIDGNSKLSWDDGSLEIKAGEAVLVPNIIESITLQPEGSAKLLEVYLTEQPNL
ncbi:MAG: class I mannose-6-phosphate isomerase [Bacteroidales bacterium]|nr:class I mannose-6-phosphate isomerase [Bacteroidales bacterium]